MSYLLLFLLFVLVVVVLSWALAVRSRRVADEVERNEAIARQAFLRYTKPREAASSLKGSQVYATTGDRSAKANADFASRRGYDEGETTEYLAYAAMASSMLSTPETNEPSVPSSTGHHTGSSISGGDHSWSTGGSISDSGTSWSSGSDSASSSDSSSSYSSGSD